MATRPKPRFIAGGDDEDDQPDRGPVRRRYPCLAHGCPMAGAIFMNGTDAPGICSLHYGLNSSEMPRVTDVLRNWSCVTFALENARRFLNDPAHCGDVKAERLLLHAQWTQLQSCAPDWPQISPHGPGPTLSDWARQLLAFLVWRLDCDVHNRPSDWQWPPGKTRTVRVKPRAALRPPDIDETPLSDAEVAIAQHDMPWPSLEATEQYADAFTGDQQ